MGQGEEALRGVLAGVSASPQCEGWAGEAALGEGVRLRGPVSAGESLWAGPWPS